MEKLDPKRSPNTLCTKDKYRPLMFKIFSLGATTKWVFDKIFILPYNTPCMPEKSPETTLGSNAYLLQFYFEVLSVALEAAIEQPQAETTTDRYSVKWDEGVPVLVLQEVEIGGIVYHPYMIHEEDKVRPVEGGKVAERSSFHLILENRERENVCVTTLRRTDITYQHLGLSYHEFAYTDTGEAVSMEDAIQIMGGFAETFNKSGLLEEE